MKTRATLTTDAYKILHRHQYPAGTSKVYSNFTPRSVKHLYSVKGDDNKVVFFGLQYYLKWFLGEIWQKNFFRRPKDEVIHEYQSCIEYYLGPESADADHLEALHDLGYMPISIRALPEGAAVSAGVPLFTIENTKDEFFWLTNFLETSLSTLIWQGCTSATIARKYLRLFIDYANETGGSPEFVQFQGHDFSLRGMAGTQAGAISGAGHLTCFTGTDSIPAIGFVEDYYNGDAAHELLGVSVPATEHSVMCMGGEEDEFETFRRLLTDLYPSGVVSIVGDSYDFWGVVDDFLPRLKEIILDRNGTFCLRPDSGVPLHIVCGDPMAEEGTSQHCGAFEALWRIFGGEKNESGYIFLNPKVSLLYGDSITLEIAEQILDGLKNKGFCSTSMIYGIGSYSYQFTTRDTCGFAMKATAGVVNGQLREIFKAPKTDIGNLKKSARGYLRVDLDDHGDYKLRDRVTREEMEGGELKEVWCNGALLKDHKFSDIRARIKEGLKICAVV